jgi:hypothetical protein
MQSGPSVHLAGIIYETSKQYYFWFMYFSFYFLQPSNPIPRQPAAAVGDVARLLLLLLLLLKRRAVDDSMINKIKENPAVSTFKFFLAQLAIRMSKIKNHM